MPDNLAQVAGMGPTIELGGHRLVVKGRIIRHYALMEAEILKKREPNPLQIIRDLKEDFVNNPEMFERLARVAIQEAKDWAMVTNLELSRWMTTTMDGFMFTVWLAVRDNDPSEWTFERVRDLTCDELEKDGDKWRETVDTAINQASGDGELGN